jgi:ubiquitin carboxyl-terminal hydrolase 34
MELRVMSIGTMDNALVDLWRAYSSSSVGTYHPVMQFVAEFLLAEKVIDYIISVKSHPQLIQRSGNIVGFLVVSHRYSERHTDAIWDIISNNQNPRFVTATLAMLRSITTLMEPDQLLYLCSKLYSMPIESYSLDVLRFLHEIYDKLRLRSDEFGSNPMRPWTVCIRIMQDTPPSRDSTTLTMDLHREACAQLETMAGSITQAEREQIYRKCTTYIAERSPKATGAVRAIYLLCAKFSYSDAGLFQQDPDIVRRISEELCAFVKAENSIGSFDLYSTALDYRLEMLCFLILEAPEAIPQDLYYDIWHHTIGQHALDNDVRDKAWNKLTGIVQRSPGNEFCKQLISFYVPKLESAFFTQGLYEFVAAYRFPTMVHVVGTGENAKELIQIPAADLLWRMMMIAPQGTIESRAAELLVRRYVEVDLLRGATVGNLEDAHVALAEKCIGELLANYKTLRHRHIEERSTKSDDNMDISLSDSTSQRAELRFSRTIFFVKLMLEKLRSKPEFSRCRRSESRPKPMEPQTNHGDQIEVTYTASSSTDKKPLVIGTENLVLDLEARLRNMTGFTKLKIFFLGRQLNVEDQMHKQLKECGLARSTHMLVQDASGGNTHHPVFEKSGGRSVFELTILDHFEELFICMDSSDDTSAVVSR